LKFRQLNFPYHISSHVRSPGSLHYPFVEFSDLVAFIYSNVRSAAAHVAIGVIAGILAPVPVAAQEALSIFASKDTGGLPLSRFPYS
jgi:hypothetical protein